MLKFIRKHHHRRATKQPLDTAILCHWPFHCWHNELKKTVTIGYAWVLQLGLLFSKIGLATGTVKVLTYKQQRARSNPQYGIITQGNQPTTWDMLSLLLFFSLKGEIISWISTHASMDLPFLHTGPQLAPLYVAHRVFDPPIWDLA